MSSVAGVLGVGESVSATPAAARPAASSLALFALCGEPLSFSISYIFDRGRSGRRDHGGFRDRKHRWCRGFRFQKTLGRRPGRWRRGIFLIALVAPAVAVPSTITVPAAIPIAHRPLVAGDLVEVVVLFKEVRNVQERIALQAHVDEGRLHSRQDARDASLMNAARERVFVGALEVDFHQLVVFDQRHLGLMPVG